MWRTSRGAATPTSSSFGMILKDKFQKNPNMYFPDLSLSPSLKIKGSKEIEEEEDWSDADTLVHNMSEGSFDKVRPREN